MGTGKAINCNKGTNKESSLTQVPLPSQNAKMISSSLISQMINENKSKGNKTAFPMESVITQSDIYHVNQSLTNHSSVNINSGFIWLPRKLGIQTSSKDNIFIRRKEKQSHNQKKGFASITITAKRVVSSANNKMKGDTFYPSCLKCQKNKLLMTTVPASDIVGLNKLPESLHAQVYYQNQTFGEIQLPEPCLRPYKEKFDWISNPQKRTIPLGKSYKKQTPISFTSSVHLRISQQCPNGVYYIDKSLLVPVEQPQTNNNKMHRSVVSFNINCSSQSKTPDGVDDLANGRLITDVLKLSEDSKISCKAIWNEDRKDNFLDKKQTLEITSLGIQDRWESTSPSEILLVADSSQELDGFRPKTSNGSNSSDNHMKLSAYIPYWMDYGDVHAFSGNNRKQSKKDKYHEIASASFLEQGSKKKLMVESRISLKDKHLCKGTSESKDRIAQHLPKPKVSVSNYTYHTKVLSESALDGKDINGKDAFPKGDNKLCGSARQFKEDMKSAKKEMVGKVTNSATQEKEVPHEKYEAHQQPEVCFEIEKISANSLTLREALEVHKPHFISHSQERLKKLEHMVQLRKAQQGDVSEKKQAATLSRKLSLTSLTSKKKQCTVPHPLSDNLFKPKERYISEKEMHMRSKRIYNNLPEVKKKQEEKQKRVIIQSNRKRVEIFKKQLLDQLLQRNTE